MKRLFAQTLPKSKIMLTLATKDRRQAGHFIDAEIDPSKLRFDGNVSRCEHSAYIPEQQQYGNIMDDGGPLIDRVNRYCWRGGCPCKTPLAFAEPFTAEFRREGTSNPFLPRAPGDKGIHSYD